MMERSSKVLISSPKRLEDWRWKRGMEKPTIKITASASVASVGGEVEGIADPGGVLIREMPLKWGRK